MPQLATSGAEMMQGFPPSGDNYGSMRPSPDHNSSTIDFNSSSLPSTTSSKSGSSADNAISIASTPAAEPSSEEHVFEPQTSQHPSRGSSPSSVSSLASDDEDDEDYAPWRTEGEGYTNKRSKDAAGDRKTAASSSKKRTTNAGPHWDEEEDSLLVKIVDRLGTKWQEVSREFNRLSSTARSYRAVEARWRILVLGDKGKAPVMPRGAPRQATRSSPAKKSKPPKPSSPAKASGPQRVGWTKREYEVLCESLLRHRDRTDSFQGIYADFFQAFPQSSRTRSAIRNRCSLMQRGVKLRCVDDDEEEEGEADEEEQETEGSGSTASGFTAALAVEEETEVSITYMPSGLIIEDLPPNYHVKVYSPTQVKVGRKSAVDTAHPPAFHFRALDDSSIEAITLPEGTTKRVEEVPADGGEGLDVVAQTVYEGPDAYRVVFRGAV